MPAATRNLLAFDLGAESGRALLGRFDGSTLTLEEKHRFPNPNGRLNHHLHWNLLAQWEELKTGLRKAAGGAGDRTDLHAIGVDTWGVDFGFLDRNGELLANPFMYRDSQSDGMMDKAFAKVPRQQIFEATGIQFMQLNSLYHLLALAERKSPLLDCAHTLLFMPDLFNYLFTGQKYAEFSIATTSQMYDPRRRAWATDMLGALGLPTHFLPPVVPSGTKLGPVRAEVMNECNVGPIPVVAPGGHDTASAVAAVPVAAGGANDWCYISSGTWSLMGVEIPDPIINAKSLALNYTNEGGVSGDIRFLKNIMGLWLVQECRRQFLKDGHDHSYTQLTQMAAAAPAFKAIIDPDHSPFLSPGQMPQKIADFCSKTNQTAPQSPGEFVRTCLESLALTYRKTIEGLEDVLGRKLSTIHIVGGGTQNQLLNQMTADACNRTVITGPVEATAIGNILVTAIALGDLKNLDEARQVVRNSFPVQHYEPRDTGKWNDAYARYRKLLGN